MSFEERIRGADRELRKLPEVKHSDAVDIIAGIGAEADKKIKRYKRSLLIAHVVIGIIAFTTLLELVLV